MPDNVDPDPINQSFDHFDEGTPVNPLPAPEVRRRGDRMRRRNTVLATVGGVAAAAVFVGIPVAVVAGSDPDDNVSPAPSPTVTEPTPTEPEPTPTESPNAFADFPLATGYPETHGSDGSPVKVTSKPGLGVIELCNEIAWNPAADTEAVIGTEYVGEAEDFRGRTLALYESEAAAAAAVEAAAQAVKGCPVDKSDDESGAASLFKVQDSLSSEDEHWLIFTQRYRTPEGLTDTGLTVFHLVQVGQTVFASYEYGEGGGSEATIASAIELATEQAEAIRELMFERCWDETCQSASAIDN